MSMLEAPWPRTLRLELARKCAVGIIKFECCIDRRLPPREISFGPVQHVGAYPGLLPLLEVGVNISQKVVDKGYKGFSEAAEQELCSIHQIPAAETDRHKGRGEEARYSWQPLAPTHRLPENGGTLGGAWQRLTAGLVS